jgi:WASH complex subunit strumpellin
MNSPFEKIYMTSEPLEHLSLIFFLFILSQKNRFQYDKNIDSIVKIKKDDEIDGTPLVIGLVTILHQFHFKEKIKFLAFLGQYIRGLIFYLNLLGIVDELKINDKNPEIPDDLRNIIYLIEAFCVHSKIDRNVVEAFIPSYLFAKFIYKN